MPFKRIDSDDEDTNDVEGHAGRSGSIEVEQREDVEGHGARASHIVADDDDVEGHVAKFRG